MKNKTRAAKYTVWAIRRYTFGCRGVDVAPIDYEHTHVTSLKEARAFRPFGHACATETIEIHYEVYALV